MSNVKYSIEERDSIPFVTLCHWNEDAAIPTVSICTVCNWRGHAYAILWRTSPAVNGTAVMEWSAQFIQFDALMNCTPAMCRCRACFLGVTWPWRVRKNSRTGSVKFESGIGRAVTPGTINRLLRRIAVVCNTECIQQIRGWRRHDAPLWFQWKCASGLYITHM